MTVWRLSSARHALRAFSGDGTMRYSGRWNDSGTRMVYCASHLSLAVLEVFVNLQVGHGPREFTAVPAEIPSRMNLEHWSVADLPDDWVALEPQSTRQLGNRWIREQRSAIVQVPSVVVPQEANYLLNPAHPDFGQIRIGIPPRFTFDKRFWK